MTSQELSSQYKNFAQVFNNHKDTVFSRLFIVLKQGLSSNLLYASLANSKLCVVDDKIYEYYSFLMDRYKNIIEEFETMPLPENAASVRDVLGGVILILKSRLIYFDELCDFSSNPILEERNKIQADNKIFFEFQMDALCRGTQNPVIIDGASVSLTQEFSKKLYELYISNYKHSVLALDNMDKNRQIGIYFDFIKNEYNELSIIIKKQIFEIENAHADNDGSVFGVLTLFRETYQHTGKFIADTSEYFENSYRENAQEFQINALSYEDFTFFVKSLISKEEFQGNGGAETSFAELKSAFELAFKKKIIGEMATNGLGHIIYFIKKQIISAENMTEELKTAFSAITKFFEEHDLSECGNFDIIHGVYDTIRIKIDCLRENRNLFADSATELIAPNPNAPLVSNLSDKELDSLLAESFADWLARANAGGDTDEIILAMPFYQSFVEKRKKQHNSVIELAKKRFIEYQKDYVLFEISTYEEIMTYSVSKLRDSADYLVLQFVEICDQTMEDIKSVLRDNNFSIIAPAPHTAFNGREHEVIMAEKSPDFKKGEVIKLMNSGYKHENVVVMRANVIAAR
ncbi:hypothetical protein AGMMS49975_07480 [Clostridia bacterium]|nr:hypothetical protein AGMMS49975_07480 [Clostridia bacterium]